MYVLLQGNEHCIYYYLYKSTLILFILVLAGRICYISQTTVKGNLHNVRTLPLCPKARCRRQNIWNGIMRKCRENCEKLSMKNFTVRTSPKDTRSPVFKSVKIRWVVYAARIGK